MKTAGPMFYQAARALNLAYKWCYPLYQPLYWTYKRIKDRESIAQLQSTVRHGMQVVDIGAGIGFYTCLLSSLVGKDGHVYAYEPDAENFGHLYRNTRRLTNATVHRCAAGERSGTIRLYRSNAMNVDHQTYDSGEGRPFSDVACVALDEDLGVLPSVDIVKIDVQGYDYWALKGMEQLLRRSPSVRVFGELSPYGLSKAGASADAYLSFLKSLGFTVKVATAAGPMSCGDRPSDKRFYTDFVATKQE